MHGSELLREFHTAFGRSAAAAAVAPGRINLIGEHTDYNDGLVMPCAIGKRITILLTPNNSGYARVTSLQHGKGLFADIDLTTVQPGRMTGYMAYVAGVVYGLRQLGNSATGFDMLIDSDIPAGAGLSSSAALCCGTGFALREAFGWDVSRKELAHVAQQAEHLFAGVRCGLMDQYACLFGSEHHAMLLDCRTLEVEQLPLRMGDHTLVLVNSGVHHELAASAYNARRASCELGVAVIAGRHPEKSITHLRDVSATMLKDCRGLLDEETFRRCQYVVNEIDRTKQAADALRHNDLMRFGALMYATHNGLRDDYEVSCAETDELVRIAAESGVVSGARMMGGGFGGCTINLVRTDALPAWQLMVREKYFARFAKEPDFYQVSAGSAADGGPIRHTT